MYRIILASESPRRKEILDQMGIQYETIPSHVEEVITETYPSDIVEALALLKAKDVAEKLNTEKLKINQLEKKQFMDSGLKNKQLEHEQLIIIGADTMVFHHGEALGKPKDRKDAIRMLMSLSDDSHEVKTGVCIIIRSNTDNTDDKIISFNVNTDVVVQALTMEQIEDYVNSGEPMDKAGAYAIQGGFGIYIKEIHGDYYNVVGFPIAKIYEELLSHGINIKKLK